MKRRYIPATAKRAKGVPGQADWRKMAPRREPEACSHIWERRYDDQQNSKGYVICVSCGAWQEMSSAENDEDQS